MFDVLSAMPFGVGASAARAVGAADGILGWINSVIHQLTGTATLAIGLIAIVIVIVGSKMGGWSFPAILISGLTAGIFFWFGTHVSDTSDKVNTDFQGNKALGVVVSGPAVPGGGDV